MQLLKQSTAVTIKIGPFLDDSDGKTAETALTLSQADVRLSKNGGNMAQKSESSACSHDELGYYDCDLNTTDTNTLGRLKLMVHESGALPVWHEFMVVPANVYNSLVGGSDYLQADAVQIEGGDATDALDTAAAGALSTYDPPTKAEMDTGLAGLNDPTAAAIADAVWDEASAGHTDAGKAGQQLWTDVDAILADTNELQTDDIPGAISGLNDPSAADVADAVWDEALADHDGAGSTGEALGNAGSGASAADIADAVWDEALAGHVDAGSAGKALGDAGSGASAADIADAVWDEAAAGHTDAGKAGQQLWTDVDAILADTNELQTDDIPGAISGLNDPTAGAIADAVWDEALSGHTDAGKTGLYLSRLDAAISSVGGAAGAGGITFVYTITSSVDAAPIADASVWVTTDQAGNNVVASGVTDVNGQITFYLDAGTYYFWRQKSGWNFSNPDTETVS